MFDPSDIFIIGCRCFHGHWTPAIWSSHQSYCRAMSWANDPVHIRRRMGINLAIARNHTHTPVGTGLFPSELPFAKVKVKKVINRPRALLTSCFSACLHLYSYVPVHHLILASSLAYEDIELKTRLESVWNKTVENNKGASLLSAFIYWNWQRPLRLKQWT